MGQINIKMVLSYDGSRYLGWQRLGGEQRRCSIQGYLEDVLEEQIGCKIRISGSGRTDVGVHALGQVANFHVPSAFLFERYAGKMKHFAGKGSREYKEKLRLILDTLRKNCNEVLATDIRILSMEQVPFSFHSRYSAIQKTYSYCVDLREVPNVFTRKYALWVPEKLDFSAMERCSEIFLGTHDFSAFCTKTKGREDFVRTIYSFQVSRKDSKLTFTVCGDGFLYHMVRILVGTLLEVGKGNRKIEQVQEALSTGIFQQSEAMVSSVGLFLESVGYE